MTAPLKIGIAGLGTVGAGVVKLLTEHDRLLSLRGGRRLKLVAVSARSKAKKRDIDLDGVRWEKDPLTLATAPDIDVVVELIGGSSGVAKRLAERALRSGKHVVTANKALLAMHGAELAALAERYGVRFRVTNIAIRDLAKPRTVTGVPFTDRGDGELPPMTHAVKFLGGA